MSQYNKEILNVSEPNKDNRGNDLKPLPYNDNIKNVALNCVKEANK